MYQKLTSYALSLFETSLLLLNDFLNYSFRFRYDPEITEHAMNNVNLTYIMNFFNQYTNFHGGIGGNISAIHRVGTLESKKFAQKIEASFQDFGLKKVMHLNK